MLGGDEIHGDQPKGGLPDDMVRDGFENQSVWSDDDQPIIAQYEGGGMAQGVPSDQLVQSGGLQEDQPKDGWSSGMVRDGDDDQSAQGGDGDQPEYDSVRREEGYDGLYDDQPKDGQEGGVIRKQGLNSTGGSSWLGTQEDRDDFVTLSDEFLSKTGALEDDMGEKKEDDLKKIEVSQVTIIGEQDDYVRLVTSLKERVVCPGDQPRTNLGLVQDVRTNNNQDMAGLTSTAVGGEDATTWVATANPRDPPSDHSHGDQSSFVRVGCRGMNVLPRGGVRVKECGDVHAGDVGTRDNTLELVEVEKSAGLLGKNESSTEPSSGGKVCAIIVVQPELGTFPVQHVSGETGVEGMKDGGSTSQIPGVLEPVWCSNASRRGLPVITRMTQGLGSITVHLTPHWGCVTTCICKD